MCSFSFFRWILWSWQKVSCAFYNQNQLNLNLLRPTLANSGRIADIAEIRLENHSEKKELKWNNRLHSFVTITPFQDRPELSDIDRDFPGCVRVSLL